MKDLVKDYSHMIKKGVSNFKNVLEAGGNILLDNFNLLPEDKKRVAQERYEACMSCPFMSKHATEFGIYDSKISITHCSICKCTIEGKVMSFDESNECAIKQYNFEQIEGIKAKWYKYDKG